jgi:acyl carrier protein
LEPGPNDATVQANERNDIGADSLDLVELIMNFEEEYNIEIPDKDVGNIVTVGDAYRYGLERLS